MAKFKAQRAQSTPRTNTFKIETQAEKLHRIKDDIAPDVTETREIIAHYLPFIELVEIEQILAVFLGSLGVAARTLGGLSEVLREAARLQILNGELARQGEEVRVLRNALFHDDVELKPEQILQINQFWNKLRIMSESPPELALELKTLSVLGERDIEQAKPALAKISPIAYLVEVEQALRKIRNHLTKRQADNLYHAASRRHPDNGDALIAINESRGKVSYALQKLGFIKEQADHAPDKEDAAKIERIWGVCHNLGRVIRVHQSLLKIEEQLRDLLRTKSSIFGELRYWSLQRLAKKAADESSILQQLESVGVTKAKLKTIGNFGIKAENETMCAPSKDDLELLQEICRQLKLAEPPVRKFGPLDELPKSKRQHLLEEETRQTKKKVRKDYRDSSQ
ncbi:MAG: hypothetical protein NTV34_00805 [Proteobacteria bacterium]|nr:hypothetical protein [Pseudomonadota bacterium]